MLRGANLDSAETARLRKTARNKNHCQCDRSKRFHEGLSTAIAYNNGTCGWERGARWRCLKSALNLRIGSSGHDAPDSLTVAVPCNRRQHRTARVSKRRQI